MKRIIPKVSSLALPNHPKMHFLADFIIFIKISFPDFSNIFPSQKMFLPKLGIATSADVPKTIKVYI